MARKNQPFLLVEVKVADNNPSPGLMMFQTMLEIPAVQLVKKRE